MGVRRCLARFLTSLAFRCALQRVQTVPAAIHSGRIPPPQPTSHGDGRLSHPPHHTGHGPFRTRPPTSVKSPFRSRNNRTAQTIIYRKYVVAATRFPSPLRLETISPQINEVVFNDGTVTTVIRPVRRLTANPKNIRIQNEIYFARITDLTFTGSVSSKRFQFEISSAWSDVPTLAIKINI